MSTNQVKGDPIESQLKKAGRGAGGAAVYRATQPGIRAGGAAVGQSPSASASPQANHASNFSNQPRPAPGNVGGRRKQNGHSNWQQQQSSMGNGEAPRQQQASPGPAARRGTHNMKQSEASLGGPKDAVRPVQPLTFQFGSVNPAFGMQIPARTTSAPPNLDEQKREQAQFEARTAALLPVLPHVEAHHMPPPPQLGPSQGPVRPPIHMMPQQPLQQHPHAIPNYAPAPKYPAPVMAPQVGQMVSHPLGPPVVQPGSFPFIPPRSSKAIKIVNPETQEEVRFDSRSNVPAADNRPGPVLTSAPLGRGMGLHVSPANYMHHQMTINHNYPPASATPFYPQAGESPRQAYGMKGPVATGPVATVPVAPATPTDSSPAPTTDESTSVVSQQVSTVHKSSTAELENGEHVTPKASSEASSKTADGRIEAVLQAAQEEPAASMPNSGSDRPSTPAESASNSEVESQLQAPASSGDSGIRTELLNEAPVEEPAQKEQEAECTATTGTVQEKQAGENLDGTSSSVPTSASDSRQDMHDRKEAQVEVTVAGVKAGSNNKRKSKKKLLQKADAAPSTSDLYNAYKPPPVEVAELAENQDTALVEKQELQEKADEVSVPEDQAHVREKEKEVDDWEEAADLPAPSNNRKDDYYKKYTRDFLLTFRDLHTDMPVGFEVNPEIADCLMDPSIARPAVHNRRGLSMPMGRHQDVRLDMPIGGFRPGGPGMMSPGIRFPPPPMVPHMRGVDAERWGHVSKGLIPSPHTSLPAMHKAERKYEIGKVTDEEQAKQRQINAILNKLTPQNFDRLFLQVQDVGIETASTLNGVISQIFDKAVMEPTFCETYARFCVELSVALPEFNENGERVTFKRVLLNKCQEEFERGKREEEEAGRDEEGDPEKREEKRVKARRRMLGNIRFIGELYKKSMLTERIMHECIKALLGEYQNPDEEDVEALCKLMTTIGQLIDHTKAKAHMDAYFERIHQLSNNQKLSSRLRFGLKDVIDLRKNGWQQRRKVEGPKKIEEVHRDAFQERAQSSRDNRFSRGASMRRGPPPSGALTPMGSQRMQGRHQDVRMDETYERPMPMPLQRGTSEDITLGPQGGLGRRGQFSSRSALADVPQRPTDYGRRPGTAPGLDRGGYGGPFSAERPLLERPTTAERLGSREPRMLERSASDRIAAYAPSNVDRPVTPPTPALAPALTEEQFKAKSDLTILEYYSARDLKEAAQCIEELKRPEFHAAMVFRWVSGSLERKETDREQLVKLLVHLSSVEPPLLIKSQVTDGFASALDVLEDTIMDVPKAADYIGNIMGKLVVGNVLGLSDAFNLVGAKKESLLESGDGFNILASVLDAIRKEKSEEEMLRQYKSLGMHVQDFIFEPRPGDVEKLLRRKDLLCLDPMLPVEAYVRDALGKGQALPEIISWLETNASSLFLDAAFLRMVMTEVLNHSVLPMLNNDYKGRVRKFSRLLKRPLTGNSQVVIASQREYILAVQLFAHTHGHPAGLMTVLFHDLYEEEVISEPALYKWNDDVKDTTPGRDQAIREVQKWLARLAEAPEDPEEVDD